MIDFRYECLAQALKRSFGIPTEPFPLLVCQEVPLAAYCHQEIEVDKSERPSFTQESLVSHHDLFLHIRLTDAIGISIRGY